MISAVGRFADPRSPESSPQDEPSDGGADETGLPGALEREDVVPRKGST
jgi:hypothetical protein